MQHPLLVEGRPNSMLSALAVAATSLCHPGRHTNVGTPCLLTPCLNLPDKEPHFNSLCWLSFLSWTSFCVDNVMTSIYLSIYLSIYIYML